MGTGSGGMRGHPVSRPDKRSWPCLAFPLPDLNPSCSLGHTKPQPCCPDAEERASCVKAVDREPRGVREHRAGPTVWRKWQQPGQLAPGSNDQRATPPRATALPQMATSMGWTRHPLQAP